MSYQITGHHEETTEQEKEELKDALARFVQDPAAGVTSISGYVGSEQLTLEDLKARLVHSNKPTQADTAAKEAITETLTEKGDD